MLCPVCNGLQSIEKCCSACMGPLIDGGRVTDWIGPYAPYEPISEMMSDYSLRLQDTTESRCTHIIYCPACMLTAELAVSEWI